MPLLQQYTTQTGVVAGYLDPTTGLLTLTENLQIVSFCNQADCQIQKRYYSKYSHLKLMLSWCRQGQKMLFTSNQNCHA